MSVSISSKLKDGLTVCFCTDVEGNLSYFKRYIEWSNALYWDDKGQLALQNDYLFIYGGDVMDQQSGSLRVAQLLVDLKNKYPERVELLLGNRDINKMRFTSELDDVAMELTSTDSTTVPFWLNPGDFPTPVEYISKSLENTKANRLRWMLKHTMGSDGDFERRRIELGQMTAADAADIITDEQVVESYLASVQPHGVLYEYLHLGKLAVIFHSTLYVHGGVVGYFNGERKSCFGHVPGSEFDNDMTMAEWVEKLNVFAAQQIEDWVKHPRWTEIDGERSRGGDALMRYAVPTEYPSVVQARQLNSSSGMPFYLTDEEARPFQQSGIKFIICGHTPQGIAPTPIRHESGPWVVMADTSYSDMTAADQRGLAVSDVESTETGFRVRGVLLEKDQTIEYTNQDEWIGKKSEESFLKVRRTTGQYVACRVENRRNFYYTNVDQPDGSSFN